MNLFALSKPKIVIKESKTKDPELYKYTLHSEEIKVTPELLQSISEGIKEDRKLHIENYLREFGLIEFNGKQLDLVLKTHKLNSFELDQISHSHKYKLQLCFVFKFYAFEMRVYA